MKYQEFKSMSIDERISMAQLNPENFYLEAKEAIEDLISTFPEESRIPLQRMQWRIDSEMKKYKDPIARMNRMVEMFWVQVNEFQDAFAGLGR